MSQIPTNNLKTSVGTPSYEYQSMSRIWKRSRAILGGELYAKEHDRYLLPDYTNLLVPFSPKMRPEQYAWYVAEAELPGLTSQYAKVITGGLLRKPPDMVLPPTVPQEAATWLRDYFTEDGRPMVSFLDEAIWEELSTSGGWITVDFPSVENYESLTKEERDTLYPYPVLWKAEDAINWQTRLSPVTGRPELARVVFCFIDKTYDESNPYHPSLKLTAVDHYLDETGQYKVQKYRKKGESLVSITNGTLKMTELFGSIFITEGEWEPYGDVITPLLAGKPLISLPVFPLNGTPELSVPLLNPIIDREIALYNKVSRRNHLLYGAATFTPVVFSDMQEEDFQKIVNSGLGSWVKLGTLDKIDAFKTPTDALADMDRAIEASVMEMSRMGIRMLAPEGDSSGVSLEIRNSSLTAQLGVLNNRLSGTFKEVIRLMLLWKYGPDTDTAELDFKLSADFNPTPLGSEWARLTTEWYQNRLIPRSVWLTVAKQHDIIPSDYDDELGMAEIMQDPIIQSSYQLDEEEPV